MQTITITQQQESEGLTMIGAQPVKDEPVFQQCWRTGIECSSPVRVAAEPVKALVASTTTEATTRTSLTNTSVGPLHNKLNFPNDIKLYDREEQTDQLQKTFFRRWPNDEDDKPSKNQAAALSPELVLISGSSGTGKSVLARQVMKHLTQEDRNGYCVLGKFDQWNTTRIPEPYSAFVGALTEMTKIWQAQARCDETYQKLIAAADKETWSVLRALVPALECIFRPNPAATQPSSAATRSENEAQQDRIPKTFKLFFQTITVPQQPLVVLLDDLQWADAGSLSLLEALVSDPELLHHVLFVGICRSNEVPWEHDFASLLRRLEDEKHTQITHVIVKNLCLKATSALIADSLHQQHSTADNLLLFQRVSELVHQKTQGNVFFVLQLLKALQEEGVLAWEQQQQQWVWQDQLWKEQFKAPKDLTVIDLVLRRIKRLPEACQTVLKIAACIGAEFQTDTVVAVAERMATNNNMSGVEPWEQMLHLAQEEHMIVAQKEHHPEEEGRKLAFVHDRIQQSAYALIPKEEHPIVHLYIGRMLYEMTNMPIFSLDDHIFLVTNQLVRGSSLLTSEEDKTTLALLCLQAGRKATTSIDFRTAVQYFQLGTGFLPRRPWRDEYSLCLELHTSLAEAQCCTTDFEAMSSTIDQILMNARNEHDKHRAYTTKIYAFAARLELQEAIDLGLEVLRCYGEKFPTNPGDLHVGIDMIRNMWLLRGKSDEIILSQPTIDVPKHEVKVAAMQILHIMTTYAFIARRALAPLLLTRLVHITLKYGLCAASSAAFALHGTLIIFIFDDVDGAYRYGDLGIQLMEGRFKETRSIWLPRVYNYFYSMIAIWKLPIQTCIDKLFQAYIVGRRTGDSEAVAVALVYYCELSFFAGRDLASVKADFVKYLDVMALCKQGPYHASSKQLFELVLNLTGESNSLFDDPAKLLSSTIYEDHSTNFGMHTIEVSIFSLILHYHLGDFEEAHKMAKQSRVAEEELKPNYLYSVQLFYDAMSSLALGWMAKRRKRLAHAGRILRKLEKLADHCPNNMHHKVCLLKAEVVLLTGKKNSLDKAMSLYKQAVQSATEEGFLHIRALALERTGWALRRLGGTMKVDDARRYLEQGLQAYQEWGAHAVAKSIEKRYFV